MNTGERWDDLSERVTKFNMMELPGQGSSLHMGTVYLVDDLWRELNRVGKP